MKTCADAGRLTDQRFLEKVKRGVAYALLGSIVTIGAISLDSPLRREERFSQNRSVPAVMEEGPRRLNGPSEPAPNFTPAEAPGQTSSTGPPAACLTDSQLEENIAVLKRSTVLIDTDEALGSGVILRRENGLTVILTNRHVVQAEDPGPDKNPVAAGSMVVHNDGSEAKVVRVLLAPNDLDLAVVFVKEDIGPPARMANATIRRGTGVVVIGSPLGIEDSATRGIISNFVGRRTDSGLPFLAIQTDAAINPGNSGGGLFLASTGELLGITTFKLRISPFETAEGMGFVIPVSMLNQYPIQSWRELPMPAPSHSTNPDAGTGPAPSPH